MNLRRLLCFIGLITSISALAQQPAIAQQPAPAQQLANLALVAKATTAGRPGATLTAVNDEDTTASEGDPWYRTLHRQANQWVEYQWPQPITTRQIAVKWWDYEH